MTRWLLQRTVLLERPLQLRSVGLSARRIMGLNLGGHGDLRVKGRAGFREGWSKAGGPASGAIAQAWGRGPWWQENGGAGPA